MTTSLKTITSSTLRDNLSDTLDEVGDKSGQVLLIQRHGETDAALINLDLLESVLDSLDRDLLAELTTARRQIKQTGEEGEGLALAGIIIGGIATALFVLVILFWIIAFVSLSNNGFS